MGDSLHSDLIKEIDALPSEAQSQVLDFVRSLKRDSSRGTHGTDLARFAGTLPKEDADEMRAIINEGRQVDNERW